MRAVPPAIEKAAGRFPLVTYKDARPWVVAIREEVLQRNMPPWGAIKGFGDFRNDQGLTPEEFELIVRWSEGGVPEGEAADCRRCRSSMLRRCRIRCGGNRGLRRSAIDAGVHAGRLVPRQVPAKASFQIMAELPDGSVQRCCGW